MSSENQEASVVIAFPAARVARSAGPTHRLLRTRFLASTPNRHALERAAERERLERYWLAAMGCPVPPEKAS